MQNSLVKLSYSAQKLQCWTILFPFKLCVTEKINWNSPSSNTMILLSIGCFSFGPKCIQSPDIWPVPHNWSLKTNSPQSFGPHGPKTIDLMDNWSPRTIGPQNLLVASTRGRNPFFNLSPKKFIYVLVKKNYHCFLVLFKNICLTFIFNWKWYIQAKSNFIKFKKKL